jgi:hypothetical protein
MPRLAFVCGPAEANISQLILYLWCRKITSIRRVSPALSWANMLSATLVALVSSTSTSSLEVLSTSMIARCLPVRNTCPITSRGMLSRSLARAWPRRGFNNSAHPLPPWIRPESQPGAATTLTQNVEFPTARGYLSSLLAGIFCAGVYYVNDVSPHPGKPKTLTTLAWPRRNAMVQPTITPNQRRTKRPPALASIRLILSS